MKNLILFIAFLFCFSCTTVKNTYVLAPSEPDSAIVTITYWPLPLEASDSCFIDGHGIRCGETYIDTVEVPDTLYAVWQIAAAEHIDTIIVLADLTYTVKD